MAITQEELRFGIFLIVSIVTGELLADPVSEFLKNTFPNIPVFALGIIIFLIVAFFFNVRRLS